MARGFITESSISVTAIKTMESSCLKQILFLKKTKLDGPFVGSVIFLLKKYSLKEIGLLVRPRYALELWKVIYKSGGAIHGRFQ